MTPVGHSKSSRFLSEQDVERYLMDLGSGDKEESQSTTKRVRLDDSFQETVLVYPKKRGLAKTAKKVNELAKLQ